MCPIFFAPDFTSLEWWKRVNISRERNPSKTFTFNPIWAGLWNDVVDWGGALSARIQFLEGSPLWIFLATLRKNNSIFLSVYLPVILEAVNTFWKSTFTWLTLKETKSKNLVSVADHHWSHNGHPTRPNRVKVYTYLVPYFPTWLHRS